MFIINKFLYKLDFGIKEKNNLCKQWVNRQNRLVIKSNPEYNVSTQ